MPRKYRYRQMDAQEIRQLISEAGLTISDLCKLFGQDYMRIKKYFDPNDSTVNPTTPEMVVLDYLAEYPEATEIMLDMVEVRIVGQVDRRAEFEKKLRLRHGANYVPPDQRGK